jgi:hypothetical protein
MITIVSKVFIIITAKVLGIDEGGVFNELSFDQSTKFFKYTNVELGTKAPLLAIPYYLPPYFL